jgi:hypothetical protein
LTAEGYVEDGFVLADLSKNGEQVEEGDDEDEDDDEDDEDYEEDEEA